MDRVRKQGNEEAPYPAGGGMWICPPRPPSPLLTYSERCVQKVAGLSRLFAPESIAFKTRFAIPPQKEGVIFYLHTKEQESCSTIKTNKINKLKLN